MAGTLILKMLFLFLFQLTVRVAVKMVALAGLRLMDRTLATVHGRLLGETAKQVILTCQ